jgi:ubiquinone/menaquinone biosynthesis C-methylase UbiE
VHFTSREISEKYDRFARWHDLVEGIPDVLGVRKLRRQLLRQASGNVLEENLPYYPPGCRIIAVDGSREMLNVARQRSVAARMVTPAMPRATLKTAQLPQI